MTDRKNMNKINIARVVILVLGVVFVILGITRGEHIEVLQKAVRVCLECIGIG